MLKHCEEIKHLYTMGQANAFKITTDADYSTGGASSYFLAILNHYFQHLHLHTFKGGGCQKKAKFFVHR